MENTILNPQNPSPAYDYRTYDQVWQRVTPGVDPFSCDAMNPVSAVSPAASAVSPAVSSAVQAVSRQESAVLPGADPDPCCMGTAAQNSVTVLEGFVQEELAASRQYQCVVSHIRNQMAVQLFRQIICEKQSAARELCAAYYLITGTRYMPSVSVEHVHCVNLAETLRSCYHQEACAGLNYARAADEASDKCLTDLFNRLSEQSYQRAEDVMRLLGRIVCCN